MIVHVLCDHPRGRAAAARLRRRARRFLSALGREDAELSLVLVGDRAIRRLNRCWRGEDVATDVLSFPVPGRGPVLGDVVISIDAAARVARTERRRVEDELDRYLAHGILHLLGHDHGRPREARAMSAHEETLLGGPGRGMIAGSMGPKSAPPERRPRRGPRR